MNNVSGNQLHDYEIDSDFMAQNEIDSDSIVESPLKSSSNDDEFSNDNNDSLKFSDTDAKENAADVEDWDTCLEDSGKFLTNQIFIPPKNLTNSLDSTETVAASIAESLSRILVICPNRSVAEQALQITGSTNLDELSEKVQAKLEEFFKQNIKRKNNQRKFVNFYQKIFLLSYIIGQIYYIKTFKLVIKNQKKIFPGAKKGVCFFELVKGNKFKKKIYFFTMLIFR